MRGKLMELDNEKDIVRITPAHAGKTASADFFVCLREDHPRACGENYCPKFEIDPRAGSPPRMRGKLVVVYFQCARLGITPAHAGKTRLI